VDEFLSDEVMTVYGAPVANENEDEPGAGAALRIG
jgi:hypothetical protein